MLKIKLDHILKIQTDRIDPIVESSADKAHRVARGIIGALPMFSGTALELFNSVVEVPLEKRKREWMLQVTDVLNELQDKFNFDIDSLASNEEFISLLLRSSQVAIKNHQKEKIKALKAALLNTAININISEDEKAIFINLLDEFTVSHLEILKMVSKGYCWSPIEVTPNHGVWAEFSKILTMEFDEFEDKVELAYQIVSDLESKKLLSALPINKINNLNNYRIQVWAKSEWGTSIELIPEKHHKVKVGSHYTYLTIPTKLGESFLNFIVCEE
jgi:hypothetical protein